VTENEIRKTIEIEASAEVVFNALTRPEELLNGFQTRQVLSPGWVGKCIFHLLKTII
jgi:hypothetical protein